MTTEEKYIVPIEFLITYKDLVNNSDYLYFYILCDFDCHYYN